ncbi:MAG: HAD-IB family phosphatase [Calothrix sp. MO_167.B12]|nr:HAD-IB family phosphatase [Calothrix sp. MO_167.B12]
MVGSKIIIFDCDSTLSSIEGIDELARIAGDEVRQQIEEMTNAAMEGKIPLESVFARRLEIIKPTQEQVTNIGELYIKTVEPSALSAIATLKENGWLPIILSAGYVQAIEPLAQYLGIESIEAVPLLFNPDGSYQDFDRTYPTTRSGGKLEIVHKIRNQYSPSVMVTVGDGVSDLETKPGVNMFIGFGRYAVREKVKAQANHFIQDLAEVLSIIPSP